MSTEVQRRRGTSSQCDAMTPAEAEVVIDLTNDRQRLGDGITQGGIHIPNERDLRKQNFVFGVAGGSANDITLAFSVPVLEYAQGLALEFQASANNTGATTINASGLGTRNIYKVSGNSVVALSGGELVTGGIYRITYDGSRFILHSVPEVNQVTPAMTLVATRSGVGHEYTGLDPDYNYKLVFSNVSGAVIGGKKITLNGQNSGYTYNSEGFNISGLTSSQAGILLTTQATNIPVEGYVDFIGTSYLQNTYEGGSQLLYRLAHVRNGLVGSSITSIRIVNGLNALITTGVSSLYRYEQ